MREISLSSLPIRNRESEQRGRAHTGVLASGEGAVYRGQRPKKWIPERERRLRVAVSRAAAPGRGSEAAHGDWRRGRIRAAAPERNRGKNEANTSI